MKEGRPIPSPPDPEPTRSWDIPAIANRLEAQADLRLDQVHGAGARVRLTRSPAPLELELFPARDTIRLSTPDLALTIRQENPPLLDDGTEVVIFPGLHHELRLGPDGATQLTLHPHPQAPEMTHDESVTPGHGIDRVGITSPSSDDLADPDDGLDEPVEPDTETISEGGTRTERERLRLSGRLGRDPIFRTTRNAVLVAKFPLAVRDDEGVVAWSTIYAFRQRAERIRQQALAKGMWVDVVGYRHPRVIRGRDGIERTVEEIYAVVVKPR